MEGALIDRRPKVVMIGSGNVATHLAKALAAADVDIIQVYSRHLETASCLAAKVGAEAIDDLSRLRRDGDLYVVSVKDDAIPVIVSKVGSCPGLWVHTSGSVAMDVLAATGDRYGVLYPMQTFSKDVDVEIKKVPVFIEGCTRDVVDEIGAFADRISSVVSEADSDARRRLHIAAVFACNFTNHLWSFSVDILKSIGQDLSVMAPLIEATLEKALKVTPQVGQTGPARRNDFITIEKHLETLQGDAKEIYSLLTQSIIKRYSDEQS